MNCLYPIKYGKDEPMQELLSKFLAMTDLEIFPKPVLPEAVHLVYKYYYIILFNFLLVMCKR